LEITDSLIKSIKDNDRKVITELYKETFSVLMSVVVRYKKNTEEQMSLVNNSFLKILSKIDQYKVGTSFFSWVKRIVQNEVIDDFRKEKKYKELFQFTEEMGNYDRKDEEPESDSEFEAEELQSMMDTLPPATKVVFNLYAIDGYKSSEIIEELGIGYETVKWHIKEARKRLRKLIGEKSVNNN
jgi:RNA polymerase sigma factor (sigma-70 family)